MLHSAPAWKLTQAAPIAHPRLAAQPEKSGTLLDPVGQATQSIPPAQALAWARELKSSSLTSTRAAELHLWLGERDLAQNQQPVQARRHFQQARLWAHQAAGQPAQRAWTKQLYGRAVYDSAVALYYEGAYQEATAAFHSLIRRKTVLPGYDVRTATLWWRHAGACAGYHAERSAQGIPEPPRLDPLCGVAAVAASLRALALPFDKKTLLSACRMTGEGSSMEDLIASGKKLGVSVQAVSADEQGLRTLPKPLVAHVEHDHFISVVKADQKGVSYLCSDCGAWPGGRVDLTWKQWRALEPDAYAVVTKPGSAWNRVLMALTDPAISSVRLAAASGVRVASVGSLAGLGTSALRVHLPAVNLLRGHVVRITGVGLDCGRRTHAPHCQSYISCPLHDIGPDGDDGDCGGGGGGGGSFGGGFGGGNFGGFGGGGSGPADGDPVNLATLEEEYQPTTDLSIYNPHGPSLGWSRIYNSLRTDTPDDATYQEDDFGGQWSQPYNVWVYDPNVPQTPNNVQIAPGTGNTFPSTGTTAPGSGLTWDIVNGASTVASSASPAGWSVSYSSGSFTVSAPSSVSVASGYMVRYFYYMNSSASFSVVSVYSVAQGAVNQFGPTGTDAPASGQSWDILQNGTTIATSSSPAGWQVTYNSYPVSAVSVHPSLNAVVGTGFEVRVNGSGATSAFFSVSACAFAPATGSGNQKFVVEPNGARTSFTAPSVPTAANPKVSCTVQTGAPLLVEWDYDTSSPAGHYTITWGNRTKWVMNAPVRETLSGLGNFTTYGLHYSLAQLVDRNGNALNFTYGYTNPADQWPLLTGIADANTGTTLLSISRDTTGFITSVADAYGRSVAYGKDTGTGAGRLSQVSQIVPAGSASPPVRSTYGYQLVAADDEGNVVYPFLHTITVPSPTGSGTSTATINYSSDDYASVTSIQDGNGNTTNFSVVDANHTRVTVNNAGGGLVYAYVGGFDGNLSKTSLTDGAGRLISKEVYSGTDPYRPTSVYDGNGLVGTGSYIHVPPGGNASFASAGTGSGSVTIWQILLNGVTVATGSSPNGWSVSYSGSSFTVGAPLGASSGDYQVQQYAGSGYVYLGNFSVVVGTPTPATNYTWDSYGNLLTQTSPRGTTTTYTYSYTNFGLGELTRVQEGTNLSPPKAPATYAYFEPSGLVQSVTAPLSGTTNSTSTVTVSYTYDTTSQGSHGLGNVLTMTAPGNNAATSITTTLGYTTDGSYSQPAAIGQPVTITNNLGKVTHLRYNALGNAVAVKDALGNETDLTYDIRNAPLQTILPATGQSGSGHGGSQTAYLYAEPSALATTQWPAVTLQYGPAATQTVYDEGNVGAVRQVVSTYGAEGELKQVTGSTEPVRYAYDSLYRLSALTDGGGHTTSYFYNAAGYPYQTVYPGAQATPPTAPLAAGSFDTLTYPSYDADGNLLSRTDGNNKTTSYTYSDPESRLTGITYPAGSIGAVGFRYDSYGRQTGLADGTGSQTFAYDDDNDLTSKTVTWTGLAAKTVSYGFYNNGSRSSMNAAGNSFAYGYDGVGRMSSLTTDGTLQASYAYRDNGWLLTKTLGNGDVTNDTRDAQGRLLERSNKTAGGANMSDFAVPATGGYDGVGNELAVTATIPNYASSYSGTTHYTYDYGQTANSQASRSQLTQETSTRQTGTQTYLYDQTNPGQPGSSTGPGNATHYQPYDLPFNSDNQISPTSYYSYDGNGNSTFYHNPSTSNSQTLTYDPENRLASYGTTQTDGWSGDGLRAWKQNSGGRTYYLYDGTIPVCEYSSTGTLTASNVFGGDGLISRYTPSDGRIYYSFDERGSVAERLLPSGSSVNAFEFDGFGNRTEYLWNVADPWSFEAQAGYYTDTETWLILCTHRFYDPYLGRFLTRDPIGYDGGVNLYSYTQNNPINFGDPSGFGIEELTQDAQGLPPPARTAVMVGVTILTLGAIAYDGLRNIHWPSWSPPWSQPTTVFPGQIPQPAPPNRVVLPDNPTQAPGPDWNWGGPPIKSGEDHGGWYNKKTGESAYPDFDHPAPIGPHWDYKSNKKARKIRIPPGGDPSKCGPGY